MRMIETFILLLTFLLMSTNSYSQNTVSVHADDIAQAFMSNTIAAEIKYADRPLNINGRVSNIDKAFGRYYVTLDAAGTWTGISIYVNRNALSDIANIKVGQNITMYCENFVDMLGFECENGKLLR